jgi:hypothetical protein
MKDEGGTHHKALPLRNHSVKIPQVVTHDILLWRVRLVCHSDAGGIPLSEWHDKEGDSSCVGMTERLHRLGSNLS